MYLLPLQMQSICRLRGLLSVFQGAGALGIRPLELAQHLAKSGFNTNNKYNQAELLELNELVLKPLLKAGFTESEVKAILKHSGSDFHGGIENTIIAQASNGGSGIGFWHRLASENRFEKTSGMLEEFLYKQYLESNPDLKDYFYKIGYYSGRKPQVREIVEKNFPTGPKNSNGEYWDMASGVYSADDFPFFDPNRQYRLFDISSTVSGSLTGKIEADGWKNIKAINQDILKITRPDQPISVIRSKNAAGYAPSFYQKLEEMADWLAPGGQIILQCDMGKFAAENGLHRNLVEKLVSEGWGFQTQFNGDLRFDTIVLTRPIGITSDVGKSTISDPWKIVLERKNFGAKIE